MPMTPKEFEIILDTIIEKVSDYYLKEANNLIKESIEELSRTPAGPRKFVSGVPKKV